MKYGGVCTCADDRSVSWSRGATPLEDQFDQSLDFILFHSRARSFHRFAMSLGSDVGSALHQLNLIIRFQHPHFMNDRGRIDYRLRRMDRFAIERAHARNLPYDGVVEIGINAEAVVEFFCAIENLVELFIKL